MLSPVRAGNEARLESVLVPLTAVVVDAASVNVQYEPGWRVGGLPTCEQGAQAPSLSSQSVRAIQAWPRS